jgi:dolichyl-phosphate-mannose-protein mannosyltransferase
MLKRLNSVRVKTALLIYVVAQIFFLINIQFPVKFDFDEFHYVPAAKEILAFGRVPNVEHPPLAKFFMAIGIGLFGDRPIGWRVMSTVFGALTLVGMYFWGHALFRKEKYARYVVAITFVNQLLYVQSRIGMLDTFMVAFLVWALAAFTEAWDATLPAAQVRKKFLTAGILFGFATACKWFAIIPWLTCVALCMIVYLFKFWGVTLSQPPSQSQPNSKSKEPNKEINGDEDFYSPDLWKGVQARELWFYFGVVPLIPYFLSFFPYFFFDQNTLHFTDLLALQVRMWGDQLRVVNSHPYMSQWKDWPLMTRPIWYAFDSEPDSMVRGVLLLGNPAIMWGGLVALLLCAWGWIRYRSREAFLILFFYIAFFGSWVVIPRKIAFYYYYYPAGMVLSLAVAYVFYYVEKVEPHNAKAVTWIRWIFFAVCAYLFIYFFPILAALKIQSADFRHWMWFNSWI